MIKIQKWGVLHFVKKWKYRNIVKKFLKNIEKSIDILKI